MMPFKKLFLLLVLSSQLFSASIYTMDNISDLNLYIDNKTDFINKKELKESLTKKLEKAGFVFGNTDSLILVVRINALEIEDSVAIYVSIGLGEEIVAKRKGKKVETFAYTYLESKFIEGYDPKADTLEALDSLINGFILGHKDDN